MNYLLARKKKHEFNKINRKGNVKSHFPCCSRTIWAADFETNSCFGFNTIPEASIFKGTTSAFGFKTISLSSFLISELISYSNAGDTTSHLVTIKTLHHQNQVEHEQDPIFTTKHRQIKALDPYFLTYQADLVWYYRYSQEHGSIRDSEVSRNAPRKKNPSEA